MSPYALELAHARIDALRTLIDALNEAETPEEKRRCAVAIFNAPDPCGLDDEIELEDEFESKTDDPNDSDETDHHGTNSAAAGHLSRDIGVLRSESHAQSNAAFTSDIAFPTSDISPDILEGLSDEEIIARAKALLDSGVFDHILAPSG